MDKTNALSLTGGGMFDGGWTPVWLIKDEFTDTVAAGSVNGTAATPGPGTRAVTDTENKLSVGSGVLAIAGGKASPAWGDPEVHYGVITREAGLSVVAKLNLSANNLYSQIGWDHDVASGEPSGHSVYFNDGGSKLSVRNGGVNITQLNEYSPGTEYIVAVVQRTNGALFFIKGGAFSFFTNIWISTSVTGNFSPHVTSYNTGVNVDYLRVLQLPAPFDTDDGLATDTHAGSVSAGTTFGHEADALIEFTVTTLATSGYMSLQFRYVDANNFWLIEIEGGSGSLRLYERVSGAYSQRGFAASAVSDGTRIVVIAENQSISVYADNTKLFTYANATNFATATAGLTGDFGTGGAISDLITWPRTLSGTAASILDKVSA